MYKYKHIFSSSPMLSHVLNKYGENNWKLVGFCFEVGNINYPTHGTFHYVFMKKSFINREEIDVDENGNIVGCSEEIE